MGRIKVYIPGIYPIQFKNKYQLLPWAQPAMSLFCGGWKNQLNPDVSKIESIDEKSVDLNNNYQSAQAEAYKPKKNNAASVTSDPAVLYDATSIGGRVIGGQKVQKIISEIKGEGKSDQRQRWNRFWKRNWRWCK